MSTTDLFVELLIIGLGAAVWVLLLIFSIFGLSWLTFEQFTSLTVLLPMLGFIYVLGIVTDRLADAIFDHYFKQSLKRQYYPDDNDQDFRDRRYLYLKGEQLINLIDYGRSRLRICRGWCFNGVLIILALNLFAWTRVSDTSLSIRLSVYGTLLMGLLVTGLWLAWKQLTLTDYRKVRDQAADLRHFLGDKEVYETTTKQAEADTNTSNATNDPPPAKPTQDNS